MKKYLYISIIAAGMTFTACNDFLDEQPSVSVNAPVNEAAQLLAIYDNTNHLVSANPFALKSTDNTEITREQYIVDANSFYPEMDVFPYLHYYEGLVGATTDYFWTGEYAKIYDANLIIESADKVTGDESVRKEALAGAYLMRAYSFHVLTTTYCLPWSEANKESLGIPLRLKLDYEESGSRGTLEQAWNQIFADMEAASQYVTRQATDSELPWRVSQCAIDAMYARLYLCRGDYDKALEYTNKALSTAPGLFDYNSLAPGAIETYAEITNPTTGEIVSNRDTIYYSEFNDWMETKIYRYPELIFPRFTKDDMQWCIPSKKLVALYDHNTDLRFKWLCLAHGNRRMMGQYEAYRFCQFDDGRYFVEGPSTPELLLNKAEIMVRKGQWQEGLQVLAPLYRARHTDSGSLTASSQGEALKVVLAERCREFPFSFIRFMDIQRFAGNETAEDDIIITRDFFEVTRSNIDTSKQKTWTINPQKGGMAMPIYQIDIAAAHGELEQTPDYQNQ